jgi:hypothetical protein
MPRMPCQVDRDIWEVVTYDSLGRAVPQDRHGHMPVITGLGGLVGLGQEGEAVDRVGTALLAKRPAAPIASVIDIRQRYRCL